MCGTTFVWSSPVLVKLTLTDTEGSTVASMLSLGSVLGPFVSGAVLDSLGRKYTVGLAMALETTSYLTLAEGSGVIILSVGRFLGGVASGIAFSAVPMYIAEISEDSVRGLLNTLSQLSICSGSLLMYVVGPYTSYAVLHYIMLGLCAMFFLLFPLLPRSPYELVMSNQIAQAEKTLLWLRKNVPRSFVVKELQLIQNTVREYEAESSSVKELFTCRGNRRALIICCTLLMLQQISGVTILLFYSEKIFRMSGSSLSSSASSIIVGAVMAGSAVICPVAVKKFGYKKPLLTSAAGMAVGMGGLAMFFILKVNHFEVDSIGWLPLFSIVVYILFFNAGNYKGKAVECCEMEEQTDADIRKLTRQLAQCREENARLQRRVVNSELVDTNRLILESREKIATLTAERQGLLTSLEVREAEVKCLRVELRQAESRAKQWQTSVNESLLAELTLADASQDAEVKTPMPKISPPTVVHCSLPDTPTPSANPP
ncbi:hypothetical protein J6590_085204 [Homalodisca vitripennis]|nr:hypothetical protein J6590_085204 [Homalodisca vitripennis]